jgi:predicted DNA-binding WGR domain protein
LIRTVVAFARKQRGPGDQPDDEPEKPEPKPAEAKKAAQPPEKLDAKPEVTAKSSDVTAKVDVLTTFDPPKLDERARADTMTMPSAQHAFGAPPDVPTVIAPLVAPNAVEEPTNMPGPRHIPGGNPDDLAPPPGLVPPGDSRSLRKQGEFALIYRQANAVITRWGSVGTRGQWRVVEYPTTASASHSYAKECSRFVSEGFSDYRA